MAKINVSQFDTRSAKRSLKLPVTEPLPDRGQVLNSTGGYTWAVDDWKRLERFLVLGSEGGTYYVDEPDLTKQNHDGVLACLKADARRTIQTVVDISVQGRAYRNEPALFVLALAAASDCPETRALALEALPQVARIGTHLYHFMAYVTAFRGTGRGVRNAIGRWFTSKAPEELAHQVVKYQQRDGWSARDMLRLAHPKAYNDAQEAVFRWVIGGLAATGPRSVQRKLAGVKTYPDVRQHLPVFIEAFEQAKFADEAELVKLIAAHKLPREAVPTDKLNSVAVWEVLLQNMPLTAMIRNLGKMTAVGLVRPLSQAAKLVTERLTNAGYLRKSRIHPMQVLVASRVYGGNAGLRGKLAWTAVPSILSALDEAFYATFPNVHPCGKPLLIGLDVSGSMNSSMAGATALRACEATAALALVHASVEPECHIFGFADTFRELGIRKGMTLETAMRQAADMNFGSTDISLCFEYARKAKLKVGGFICMTDNEVNCGRHPALALRDYRANFVPDARSVMLATTSTPFTCNDPEDAYGLDVVGFDSSVPSVVADFIRGEAASVVGDAEVYSQD